MEVASNDGYLLQYFLPRGIPVLGIEPAANVAKAAVEKGVPTRVEFFGEDAARRLLTKGLQADLIIGNNVLAQVPDLRDFMKGLKILLKPQGVITLEFPHLVRLVQEHQLDTIYHEHFSYFSMLSVNRCFELHGLKIFDVEELPTHGGVVLGHLGEASGLPRHAAPRDTTRPRDVYELDRAPTTQEKPPTGQQGRAPGGAAPSRDLARRAYFELMMPDQEIGWFPFAWRAAHQAVRRSEVDIILASASPFTSLLVADAVARSSRLPWVADLRDLWMDNAHRKQYVLRDPLESRLERRTLANASALVTVGPELARTHQTRSIGLWRSSTMGMSRLRPRLRLAHVGTTPS